MPKKILIINTGGTLSSVKSSKGLVPQNESTTPRRTCPAHATEKYQRNFRKRTGR